MKHIKVFENNSIDYKKESLKEYFKPKINWASFNYLLDRIMKYEDDSYDVTVLVCVGDPTLDKKFPIFGYSTKHDSEYTLSASVETLIKKFEEFNDEFYYRIFMKKMETGMILHNADDENVDEISVYVTNFQDNLYMTELQHRYDRIEKEFNSYSDDELILKDKI